MEILKESLAEYKFAVYEKVQDEHRGEEEGLGILSKYPILVSELPPPFFSLFLYPHSYD